MKRRYLVLYTIISCTLLFMHSCSKKKPGQYSRLALEDWHTWVEKAKSFSPEIGSYGGSLIVSSFGSDPKTFNLITSNETSSSEVLQFVFEGLVSFDVVTQKSIPALAESWTVSEDFLAYDFQLRRDVVWSDGTPFTADDVVFSFEAIYDKRNLSAARDILTIRGRRIRVEKTGSHSVRMTLPFKFAPFLKMITWGSAPILPKHKLYGAHKAGTFSSTWEIDTKVEEIVGTGPFVITSYRPSQQLVLKRNPIYWRKDAAGNRLPYLDKIVFLYVKDRSAELLKFKNGETDFLAMRGEDYPVLKPLEQKNDFRIYNLGPGLGHRHIIFNQNTGIDKETGEPLVDPVKLKWFRNRKFRQAVAYCIDKEQMVNIIHNGLAEPRHTPVNEAAGFFHNPNVRKYPFNPDSARAILTSEGFTDKDSDGLLEDPDGNPVEFALQTNAGNTDRKKYCELIRKDLEKIGIKVHFSLLEFNNLVDKLDHTYKWEAIVLGLTGGNEPHSGANVWQSSGRTHEWFPYQESPSTPWEARIDTIFTLAAQEMDPVKRKKLYDEWQQIYSEQLPFIILVSSFRLFAVRNKFGNINPVPIAEAEYNSKRRFFHNIEEIFVLPSYKN